MAAATSADDRAFDLATIDVISPEHYERNGYPHREWRYLRRARAGVLVRAAATSIPFWAITKHADIVELSKQPERSAERAPAGGLHQRAAAAARGRPSRHLLNMDPPDHAEYRRVASKRFTPRAVQALGAEGRRITREILDDSRPRRTQGDFVRTSRRRSRSR